MDECLPISTRLEEKTDGFVDTENASATPNVVDKNNDTLKKSNVEKLEDTVTDDTQMVETSKLHVHKSLNPLVNETSTTSENDLISSGSNHLSETSQFPNVPSATSQDTVVVSPVVPEDGKTPDVISQNEDEKIEKLSFGALSLIMDYDSPPSSPNKLQMNVITPGSSFIFFTFYFYVKLIFFLFLQLKKRLSLDLLQPRDNHRKWIFNILKLLFHLWKIPLSL